MAEAHCTAIVAYEVAYEDGDRFLDSWKKTNDFLKKQPGFVSATLHRAVSASPDFRFVNVGKWETEDAFRAAMQNQGFRDVAARLQAFPVHASAYEIVKT